MKDKNDLEVNNYEHNTKMHYEALRKELDIVLTSSIPQQLSNIKTLLWVNFIMIGLVSQFIKKFPLHDIIIGFYLFSIIAIILVMVAMLTNRISAYGVPIDITYMSRLKDTEWTISEATMQMMRAIRDDLDLNYMVIQNRAKLMHLSTWYTLLAILFVMIAFSIKQLNL